MKKVFLFIALTLSVFVSQAQDRKIITDESGIQYYADDATAVTNSGKIAQIFRAVNEIREESGLPALVYQKDDQPLANLRARSIVSNFKASMASSFGEIIYRGSYAEISRNILDTYNLDNHQYYPGIQSMSVGIRSEKDRLYVVLRLF